MKTTLNALVAIAALSPQIAHAETVTYYHMDALGSPVAATDASGHILWREEYAPYGERIRIEDSDGSDLDICGRLPRVKPISGLCVCARILKISRLLTYMSVFYWCGRVF